MDAPPVTRPYDPPASFPVLREPCTGSRTGDWLTVPDAVEWIAVVQAPTLVMPALPPYTGPRTGDRLAALERTAEARTEALPSAVTLSLPAIPPQAPGLRPGDQLAVLDAGIGKFTSEGDQARHARRRHAAWLHVLGAALLRLRYHHPLQRKARHAQK
jgi:hypothetical protein